MMAEPKSPRELYVGQAVRRIKSEAQRQASEYKSRKRSKGLQTLMDVFLISAWFISIAWVVYMVNSTGVAA